MATLKRIATSHYQTNDGIEVFWNEYIRMWQVQDQHGGADVYVTLREARAALDAVK